MMMTRNRERERENKTNIDFRFTLLSQIKKKEPVDSAPNFTRPYLQSYSLKRNFLSLWLIIR